MDLHSPSSDMVLADGYDRDADEDTGDVGPGDSEDLAISPEDPDEQPTDEVDLDGSAPNRCTGRVIEAYQPETETWTQDTVCHRDERCVDGECIGLPDGFGESCDGSDDCDHDELSCEDSHCVTRPTSEEGGECVGEAECRDEMICARRGSCQTGAEGDPCMDDDDCAEGIECGSGGQCRALAGLGKECGAEVRCASGNCSNDHCAPEGFSYIPAGTFCMGSTGRGGTEECPDGELELGSDAFENPRHQVTLTRPFFLSQTEVTQDQWDALFDTNPSVFHDCGGDCPVDSATWFEALEYLNALSRADGLEPCYVFNDCEETAIGEGWFCMERPQVVGDANIYECSGYRLPTEAEWEYAYRAGTTTATYNGDLTHTRKTPIDPALDAIAWYGGNSEVSYSTGVHCELYIDDPICGPHPVASKTANAWGLFDMAGNLTEFAWDVFGDYPEHAVEDPEGTGTFWYSVVSRGGYWSGPAMNCRAANRDREDVSYDSRLAGFRIARTVLFE